MRIDNMQNIMKIKAVKKSLLGTEAVVLLILLLILIIENVELFFIIQKMS